MDVSKASRAARRESPPMGRTKYCGDPHAPKANSLIPASNMLVVDDVGAILLQRRRDTGQWALPGGAQEIGETAAECAVRECLEETGIVAEITGFLGVYTNPQHIVAYSDGEIRQQYETTYIGRPVGGKPTVNDEADAVRFVNAHDLDDYDIHPSMRQQIGDYLAGTYPPLS
jgi:8-oxo-dGTP pyrophosphatase MutT (NUDIX family)